MKEVQRMEVKTGKEKNDLKIVYLTYTYSTAVSHTRHRSIAGPVGRLKQLDATPFEIRTWF